VTRFTWIACLAALVAAAAAAPAKPKPPESDSPIVAATRKKLDRPVTVNFQSARLQDALEELEKQADVRFRREAGISGNQAITYTAKNKPLKEVLDEMFKEKGLGYIIHRKENLNDRYEGWITIVMGDQRGDPITKPPAKPKTKPDPKPKPEPKPQPEDAQERAAAAKLKLAKIFIEDGKLEDAREYCQDILKRYPKTKAAAEAKELLDKLKK
jgi:TolA-binding protein